MFRNEYELFHSVLVSQEIRLWRFVMFYCGVVLLHLLIFFAAISLLFGKCHNRPKTRKVALKDIDKYHTCIQYEMTT